MTFKTPNHCVYFNLKFPYRETLVYMAEQIKALKLQALRQTGMHKKTGMQLSFCGLEGNFFKAQWTPMSDSDQHFIPNSFTDLFKDPARPYAKASEPFAVVLERYDLCEDMAQMLYQPSLNMMGSLNITESDVIDRTLEGLLIIPEVVNPKEAKWIVQRLCELLQWSDADLASLLDRQHAAFLAKSPWAEKNA
jgi:hypothetical protein